MIMPFSLSIEGDCANKAAWSLPGGLISFLDPQMKKPRELRNRLPMVFVLRVLFLLTQTKLHLRQAAR